MHKSMIAFLINDNILAVEGRYEDGGKTETFKTMDPNIAKYDLVVVESSTRHGMTVVKVTAVDVEPNLDSDEQVKWIVQRIDKDAFQKVLDMEAEAVNVAQAAERRRKKAEMRESMFANAGDELNALKLADHSDEDVTE